MKLAIVLFLCLVPLKLEPFTSNEERFSGSGMFDEYVAMEQDVTRVEQELAKYFFAPKQKNLSVYPLRDREGPVIKKDTWTPWDDRKFPIRNDVKKERPYAVLPNSDFISGCKEKVA